MVLILAWAIIFRLPEEGCVIIHRHAMMAVVFLKMLFFIPGIRVIPLVLLFSSGVAYAKGVYQAPADFIQQAFQQAPPPASIVQLDEIRQNTIKQILGRPYQKTRIRYHIKGTRSVWVLEEIGKEQYITAGIIVNDEGIEDMRILIFRETRGWEIRHTSFTDQFKSAKLDKAYQLTQPIDNITGATLSVRAVKKLARMALFLHQYIRSHEAP